MASTTALAFQVKCSMKRSSLPQKFDNLKATVSSKFKPFLKERELLPMRMDAPKVITQRLSDKVFDALVGFLFEFVEQPLLPSQMNFAPVQEIQEPVIIGSIEGEIPQGFPEGAYLRIGPNPLFGGWKSTNSMFGKSSQTWMEGEGMIHALYFQKGNDGNSWHIVYKNKYVRSETFKLEAQKSKPSFLPIIEGNAPAILSSYLLNFLRFGKLEKDHSNTNIVEHAGKFYALAENHLPQEFDLLSLHTFGQWDVDEAWTKPFMSHPKTAPDSGELVFVGADATQPYVELGIISADGKRLLHKVDLQLKRSIICHDIGVTDKYNVIMDFPLTVNIARVLRGGALMKYDKHEYARIGVMTRYGEADSIKWFEVEPNVTLHIFNCFEDGEEEVVVWGCRALESIIPGPELGLDKFEWFSKRFRSIDSNETHGDIHSSEVGSFFTRCYEWRLNMKTGKVKERNLTGTEHAMEFPMINQNFTGKRNKYGYTQVCDLTASSLSGMAKYGGFAKLFFEEVDTTMCKGVEDLEKKIKVEYHMFEDNVYCSGATFIPKPGGLEEDDGWIIAFVHNENTDASQVYIIDTKKFSPLPTTTITLPCRVPYGFHGAYMQLPLQSL